jgi:hypothetical protein
MSPAAHYHSSGSSSPRACQQPLQLCMADILLLEAVPLRTNQRMCLVESTPRTPPHFAASKLQTPTHPPPPQKIRAGHIGGAGEPWGGGAEDCVRLTACGGSEAGWVCTGD